MGRMVSWGDVGEPVAAGFQVGIAYLFEVESLVIEDSSTGKAMVRGTLRCTKPVESQGHLCYENWTIGSTEDPQGLDPQQLLNNNFFRQITKLMRKAKTKLEGKSLEQALAATVGKTVGVIFKAEKDKQTGTMRTRPGNFFTEGEYAPGTDLTGTRPKPGAPAAPAAKPRVVVPPPPPVDDDEPEPTPKPVAAKAKPKVAAAPPPDDDNDYYADEE